MSSSDRNRVILSENMENERRLLRGRGPVWLPEFPHIKSQAADSRTGVVGAVLTIVETIVALACAIVIVAAPVLGIIAFILAGSPGHIALLGAASGVLLALAIVPFALGAVSLASGHPRHNAGVLVFVGVSAVACAIYLWSIFISSGE